MSEPDQRSDQGGNRAPLRVGAVTPDVEVRDNPAANRYEAWVDGQLAGFAEYRPAGGRLVFVHTEVLPAFAGRGIGNRLAAGALEATRGRGLTVTPRCPFIAAYIRSHPEYRDMVVGVRGSSAAHGPGEPGVGSSDGGPNAGAPAGRPPGD